MLVRVLSNWSENDIFQILLVRGENGNYKCLNYEKPNDVHEESVTNIFNDLEMTKVEENKEEK